MNTLSLKKRIKIAGIKTGTCIIGGMWICRLLLKTLKLEIHEKYMKLNFELVGILGHKIP